MAQNENNPPTGYWTLGDDSPSRVGELIEAALAGLDGEGSEQDPHAPERFKAQRIRGGREVLHEAGYEEPLPDSEGQVGDDLTE